MALTDHPDSSTYNVEITDGAEDRGIDAIGVDSANNIVVVVQSKWRHDGTGSVDLAGVLKFVNGVKYILDIDGTGLPPCSKEMRIAVQTVMQTPGASLKIIVATTATDNLSSEVAQPLEDLLGILNDVGDDNKIAEYSVFTQSVLFRAIGSNPHTAIDADLQLLNWGRQSEPVAAYFGRVSAREIAAWYSAHGQELFAENIRVVLPKSEINDGIRSTVLSEPENFWYYNNGITVLATKIEKALAGAGSTEAALLRLRGISIVNGAQTVSTLGSVLKAGHEAELNMAYVAIRIIELSEEQELLARNITRYANTQNVVAVQDFAFLDAQQHRLGQELRLLGYEYILRSGERPSSKDAAKILDVRQVAVALACATGNIADAVLAKREVSRLFDRESGTYKSLFNPSVHGLLVQRAVDVVNAVAKTLDKEAAAASGIRSGIAIHGRLLISHLVLGDIGRNKLANPDVDLSDKFNKVPSEARRLLDVIEQNFPAGSYPANVFKNKARCDEIVSGV
ncbi:AIPR family protein [Arthrobacter sp. UYCo732]|uniref:AIPR family protein n=1 Tax=Arthrobacter sp. UYCo732 TaxID=3156336 RepID=UPI003398CD07